MTTDQLLRADLPLTATVLVREDEILVEVLAPPATADRRRVYCWALSRKHLALAQRLAKAVEAGAVFRDLRRCTADDGSTFVHGAPRVLGRMLNADLCRLGF